ncbi:MAG: hypothetical protein ABI830_07890, partial [Pseudolabrys sp.]
IARALVGHPSVLVLDEPTANLDASTEAVICKLVADQRTAGRTIIVVTHHQAMLAIADDIICLDKGGLVYSGPAQDAPMAASMGIFGP